jgi:SNF2 family DNA or RNA helicase
MNKYGPDASGNYAVARLTELKNLLSIETDKPPVMLRRLKEEHWLERPNKKEIVYQDPMPDIQAAAYNLAIAKARANKNLTNYANILEAIHNIRQISLHCPVLPETDIFEIPEQSARISRTLTILDKLYANSNKCLIFIEYIKSQSILSEILSQRYKLRSVPIINGSVTGDNRLKIVQQFQNAPRDTFAPLILSPKAGGLGLNLTAATHVIHLTRWWNPAVEDQCSDRAYRIGQYKDVTIHYPLAIHPQFNEKSFDMKLHTLLSKKRALSKTLLAPTAMSEKEAHDFLDDMFSN